MDFRAPAARARHRDRAAEPFDDVLGDGEPEPGAPTLGGEVRIEDVRQILRADADAAIASVTSPSPLAACRALTSMFTSAIRSRSWSAVIGLSCSSRRRTIGAPGPACAAAADARHSALTSTLDRSKRIGRAKSSTSLTIRFRRPTSSSMSAATSRIASAVTSGWRKACSDALMIIRGFLTSWAMTVDSRPSDVSRSFCEISR